MRDERNKLVELELNTDEKYAETVKQYHTQHKCDMYKSWQYSNTDLLTRECLSKHRPITCRKTFNKYIPNHIKKVDFLTQFGCEKGIGFEWIHKALIKALKNNHECGDPTKCVYYTANMGDRCTCIRCNNCVITKLESITCDQLLHELCCDNIDDAVPLLCCVTGRCFSADCGSKKVKRIFRLRGCSTFKLPPHDHTLIPYFIWGTIREHGKSKKVRSSTSLPWCRFTAEYLKQLNMHLFHRYVKERQEQERNFIWNRINNQINLPEEALITTFDYGGNIICAPDAHPHCGGIKEISIMAAVSTYVVDGQLKRDAFFMLSNQSAKGWYSAVPTYKTFLNIKIREFESRDKQLKTHVAWSDGGGSDYWCAPFMGYAMDICEDKGVNLNMNRTPPGHSKWIHDGMIAYTKKKTRYGFTQNLIVIRDGDSIAGRACSYLRTDYMASNNIDNTMPKQFIEIPVDQIRVANSPMKRILTKDKRGILTYHSLYCDKDGNLKFRIISCHCNSCMTTNFKRCDKRQYNQDWVDCNMRSYPSYNTMPLREKPNKRRRVSNDNDSNHNG